MSQKLCLISLGCNKNLVDSEVMLGRLADFALTDEPSAADVIIVNTCGFIASAKKESIDKILQVAFEKPKGAILIVSGCLSARYAEELRDEIPEIDIITGVGDYDKIDSMIKSVRESRILRDLAQDSSDSVDLLETPQESRIPQIIKTKKPFLIERENRVVTGSAIHAYIKISEGCNQRCSFCAIPQFKGALHSRDLGAIMSEVERLLERGYRDFSFIAQDSSSWMRDLGQNDALIELINAVERSGARSARILYLYPSTTSERLIAAIADSRVFQNYFDMPLQHISDSILAKMKRGADKKRHIALLNAMRACENSFIRTTFLLGHPGESERDFAELCEFVSDFSFERANIFAFSKEEGTSAFSMPHQVDSKVTKARIKQLNAILARQQKQSFKNLVGRRIPVIIEGASAQSEMLLSARDVRWDREIDGEILINDSGDCGALGAGYYEAEITDFKGGFLLGRVIRAI